MIVYINDLEVNVSRNKKDWLMLSRPDGDGGFDVIDMSKETWDKLKQHVDLCFITEATVAG